MIMRIRHVTGFALCNAGEDDASSAMAAADAAIFCWRSAEVFSLAKTITAGEKRPCYQGDWSSLRNVSAERIAVANPPR